MTDGNDCRNNGKKPNEDLQRLFADNAERQRLPRRGLVVPAGKGLGILHKLARTVQPLDDQKADKGDADVGDGIEEDAAEHAFDGPLRRFAPTRRRKEKHNLQQSETKPRERPYVCG